MWQKMVESGRSQMTVWRMHIAFWIPKAANTPSEYVTLIVFTLQQWLYERPSLIRYTYIAGHVWSAVSFCKSLSIVFCYIFIQRVLVFIVVEISFSYIIPAVQTIKSFNRFDRMQPSAGGNDRSRGSSHSLTWHKMFKPLTKLASLFRRVRMVAKCACQLPHVRLSSCISTASTERSIVKEIGRDELSYFECKSSRNPCFREGFKTVCTDRMSNVQSLV